LLRKAVVNTIRHAGAQQIRVELDYGAERLTLRLEG